MNFDKMKDAWKQCKKLYSQTRYNTKKKLQKDRAKLHINSMSLPTSSFVLKEFRR